MSDELPRKVRADRYATRHGIELDFIKPLGAGTDGIVFTSERNTAVKVFDARKNYASESECYRRFAQGSIFKIRGFTVPKLIDSDDELMIVEMQIVKPPYVLDFGKVGLDQKPDFSAEVWSERHEYWESLFEDHWPEVQGLLSALRHLGIYYLDPKPGNIMFENWPYED